MVSIRLVDSVVSLGERELTLLRPRDSVELLDENAFARDEFMPYWAELWPSGLALARSLYARDLRAARVVELGCGLGLPSLAAALRGAGTLATDWSAEAVALLARNARRNGAPLTAAICDWSAPERLLAEAPWDVVLAADVLYERRNADALLQLLPRLVDRAGEALLADPGRPACAPFLARASRSFAVATVADGVFRLTPV
jgi:predicted nicotinamide N-methyase